MLRRTRIIILAITLFLATLAIPLPIRADNALLDCGEGGRDDAASVGDFYLVGDAPDGVRVLVPEGCWNGSVATSDDTDHVRFKTAGRFTVEWRATSGCYTMDLHYPPGTFYGTKHVCAEDGPAWLGFLHPSWPLDITFRNGTGDYFLVVFAL